MEPPNMEPVNMEPLNIEPLNIEPTEEECIFHKLQTFLHTLLESYIIPLIDTYLRPFIILLLSLLFYNFPTLLHKLKLTFLGILYFLFCHDKSWKQPQDPWAHTFAPLLSTEDGKQKIEKTTIIFIRHGESTWNETFNKGSHRSALRFAIVFVPNLIKAILVEFYLLITGRMDSWFYDAPLSNYGISQIEHLHKFLNETTTPPPKSTTDRETELLSILRGDPTAPPSQLLSSNLRRALSTMTVAFRDRLARNNESIQIVPSLQEISRNPDTLSLTPAHEPVTASWIDRDSDLCDFQEIFTHHVDMRLHIGNKPLNTNGLKRMTEFCEYAFRQPTEKVLIVGGHSIWFRYFFKTFLPFKKDHISKKKKIVNGGCVGFTLWKTKTVSGDKFMIDPKSLTVVYGGFK